MRSSLQVRWVWDRAFVLGDVSTALIAAQHLWMAGLSARMTLAVMTRATLGHYGTQADSGTVATVVIFCAYLAAVGARMLAPPCPC